MLRFHIPGMSCGGCARSVTAALLGVDPQATIDTNLPAREVQVESTMDARPFLAALSAAGFPHQE